MKVIIIEDEVPAANRLKGLLQKSAYPVEIVKILHGVQSTIQWLRENPEPDLAFMDIELGDGIAFEIFENTEVPCPVIFTTAYHQYAIEAFKVNSIDYLLKPIDAEELDSAMGRYESRVKESKGSWQNEQLSTLIQSMMPNYKQRFLIRIGEKYRFVNTSDIAYFYSESKTSFARTLDGRDYPIDPSLDKLEGSLDPTLFFRANRQYLIRIDRIHEIHTLSGSKLSVSMLDADVEVLISREKASQFKQWLDQ